MNARPDRRSTPIRVWNDAASRDGVRLTGLRTVRDDPARLWILLDNRRAGLVERDSAAALGLPGAAAENAPWRVEWHEKLDPEVRAGLCRRSAERLLAARMRCRAGLVRALVQRGHDRATAEACAEHFASLGAVDDARYAEVLVRNELARKPAGRRLLEAKLRAHGVAREHADRAIDEALGDRDELADARRAAAAAARTLRPGTDRQAARRRLSARLARRGFGPGVIREALDEVLREAGV